MRFIFSCHLPRRQQPCTSCLAFWQCQARDEGVEKGFWCHAKQVSDEAWGLLEIAEILIAEMGRACARREGVWSFAFLVRALLLLFLIGLTDIFQSRNQNVSNHLRQSICSQCPHSTVHTQHYSNPASFQETRSSWEANIYLHSLTLLSDCLILLSDSPLLFHCPPPQQIPPQLSCKTSSTKRHDFPGGFVLCGPDDATCTLVHLWELPGYVCTSHLAVQWSLLCITHKSSWNTYKGCLCISSHLTPVLGTVSHPTSALFCFRYHYRYHLLHKQDLFSLSAGGVKLPYVVLC